MIRTNALEFLSGEIVRLKLPLSYKIYSKIRSFLKRFISMDEHAWNLYDINYRAEIAWNNRFFTADLSTVDFKFIDGKIYLLGDCKPVSLTCRCIYEAVYNLSSVTSFAEIGVGGGIFIANLQIILGERVKFSAYDISEKQLLFFKEQYPYAYRQTSVGVLDLTENRIAEDDKPDVVLASTVLMHIHRPEAYRRALHNLLQSGSKYIVLMDNWNAHDYFADLSQEVAKDRLFCYDSGANICIIVALQGDTLDRPYQPLNKSSILGKYLRDYRY